LKEQLAAKRKELLPEAAAELRAKARLEAETRRRTLRDRLEVLKKQERTWTEEVNRLINEGASLALGAPDLEKVNDEIIGLEAATRTAREQLETAKMEALAPSRVTLLEKPVILPKDTAKPLRFAGLAGFGVFGLVAFGLAFLEFQTRRVTNPEQV